MLPRVVYEPTIYELTYPKANIRRFAELMRRHPTPAERRFDELFGRLNGGAMRGRYVMQHVISGKWIVDVFIPEVRLAIEIDGSIHLSGRQHRLDRLKECDCKRFDITLLRVSNSEVFGEQERLVERLREGWRLAKRRKNRFIGRVVHKD